MYQDVVIRGVGQHRGAPRLYLDMSEVERASFTRGKTYRVEVDEAKVKVTVLADEDGDRVVSGKETKTGFRPVIDLSSKKVLGLFEGHSQVRVVFMQGRIHILPLASVIAQKERLDRLRRKLESGEALAVASLAHGGGIMSHAAHAGAQAAGIGVRQAVVNEIDGDLMETSRRNNSVWGKETRGLNVAMQELVQDAWVFDRLPRVEILEGGIPCSGHSRAGTTKRKLEVPEAHPEVGHLVAPTLMLVQKMQPAVVVIENVPGYKDSASAWILRSMLRDMGYTTSEVVLDSKKFGALESRVRWFMVAMTAGLSVDLQGLEPDGLETQRIADILDPIEPDDARWRSFDYLKAKAARDAEAGKGFKMQLVDEQDEKIGTLRKGYHKGGTVDPLLKHPTRAGMLRLLTGDEHARCAGVPPELVKGRTDAEKHQMLGQGVAYEVVKQLFTRVFGCVKSACNVVGEEAAGLSGYGLKGVG
jgi:DNA (cytosine-5)-methyltransferase 1